MSEQMETRCPQCATLYPTDTPQCPHCGLPRTPQNTIEQIERLLGAEMPSRAPSPIAPLPVQPTSPVFGTNPGVPAVAPAPAGVQAQWEQTAGRATGTPAVPRVGGWFRRHRAALGVSAVAVGLVVLAVLISVALQAAAGYRSSPENLVRGIQKAIETEDARLFLELVSGSDVDIDEMVASFGDALSRHNEYGFRIETEDVIMGQNGKTAMIAVKMWTGTADTGNSDTFQRQMLLCYKEKGQWYMSSGYVNWLYYGLLGR